MSAWIYGVLFIACMSIASICAMSLIGDYMRHIEKDMEKDRRERMREMAKEMIQEWKDSQIK